MTIIRRRWKRLTIGRCRRHGLLSSAFPTPEALVKAGKRKWEKFLHVHKLGRPTTYQRRLEIFARAHQFAGSDAAIRAKSRLAVARAKQLQLLETQIAEYRQEIRRLFAQHPDAKLFGSLPGAGDKIAPRLLAEIGDDRALFPDAQASAMFGWHRARQLSIRPDSSRLFAPPMQQVTAQCRASLGQLEPRVLSVGGDLLCRASSQGQKSCLRLARLGPALVENRLEDVADPCLRTTRTCTPAISSSTVPGCCSLSIRLTLQPRLDTLIFGQHSRREIIEAKSPSSASTVQVEVEGKKGDTTLTGADELYHDEAFRAKAGPPQPIFNGE